MSEELEMALVTPPVVSRINDASSKGIGGRSNAAVAAASSENNRVAAAAADAAELPAEFPCFPRRPALDDLSSELAPAPTSAG